MRGSEELTKLDVLIFAPHPDDAELGMGGTILKLVDEDKRVGIIDLTRGELGTKGDAETRAKEAQRAGELLGLHYRGNLDLGDGNLVDNEHNRLKVVDCIRRFRSPYVFICPPYDPHPDHYGASRLVKAAFFLARLPKVKTDYTAFSAQQCLYYFIHERRSITFAVDISYYFERKKEVMKAYTSQFVDAQLPDNYKYIGTSDYLGQIEAYNRTIGASIAAKYAEGYYSEVPLSLHLPTIIG